ncbi:MAG: hypothetical protein IT365_22180 [Candidatus Hydrogenedentes bacterium]|nr:hypothetical protein [Candidatus Hydrogenedentota bacterium]
MKRIARVSKPRIALADAKEYKSGTPDPKEEAKCNAGNAVTCSKIAFS